MSFPPVIDSERIRRVYPQPSSPVTGYNWATLICLFFIVVGILVLIKRYRDKQSSHVL